MFLFVWRKMFFLVVSFEAQSAIRFLLGLLAMGLQGKVGRPFPSAKGATPPTHKMTCLPVPDKGKLGLPFFVFSKTSMSLDREPKTQLASTKSPAPICAMVKLLIVGHGHG